MTYNLRKVASNLTGTLFQRNNEIIYRDEPR